MDRRFKKVVSSVVQGSRRRENAENHSIPVVDGQAEEAMNFYVSIFKNSKVVKVTVVAPEVPDRKGA